MKKINNKLFALAILIMSCLSILIVYLLVTFKLSQNDLILLIIRLYSMLLTVFLIITCIIFLIIFLVRLVLKKKNCLGKALSIVSAITIIMIISTAIMLKEESKYYHTLNMNWNICLPSEYEELYFKDSGASFLGDGERYSVFQYKTTDEINKVLEWQVQDTNIVPDIVNILKSLEVPQENYPDFNNNFKYYYKLREDNSKLYIILNNDLNKIYIVEYIM